MQTNLLKIQPVVMRTGLFEERIRGEKVYFAPRKVSHVNKKKNFRRYADYSEQFDGEPLSRGKPSRGRLPAKLELIGPDVDAEWGIHEDMIERKRLSDFLL